MHLFEWLESSALAEYIRHSHLLYPAVETVHIFGFVCLVGSAFVFDLRLLGVSKQVPVTSLARHVLPWSRRSLLLVIPSGLILFMTQATTLAYNRIFWVKLILIALAFINAGFFHRNTFRDASIWEIKSIPAAARTAGIISLLLWTGVLTCGRFLAYLE